MPDWYRIKKIYVGQDQVRPKEPETLTISWEEKADMSFGRTYSDDAAWLTAWDSVFDDFFWYSAVLLNTNWVETAEMTQSWWVFTWAMTSLGNITSWDNVMIKFPVRWIKMSKSWSIVTLSITKKLNEPWYQYYAHCNWTLSNPWTPKDAFYLWAYEWCNASSKLKSWSWQSPWINLYQSNLCAIAKANNVNLGRNIVWFYQRMYVNALYMMKYWNPNSQNVVWMWYVWANKPTTTWWTNSQTDATYGTSSTTQQMRLFWLEDRWGNAPEWLWGMYTDWSKNLYVQLSWYSWAISWWESTWVTLAHTWSYYDLSSIAWDNKWMFAPKATVNNSSYSTYYSDIVYVYASRLAQVGWHSSRWTWWGALNMEIWFTATQWDTTYWTRLMFL